MKHISEGVASRNLLWMHPSVVSAIHSSHLTIVGCGGVGLFFVTYAAHLGFRNFTLWDNDQLDATNLNRYFIATPKHIGCYKVNVISDYLHERFPDINIECLPYPFPQCADVNPLAATTLVIGCVDNVEVRVKIDISARTYHRTLIDLGSGFVTDSSGTPSAAGGQVVMSRPDGPCLMCLGFDVTGNKNTYFIPRLNGPEPSSILLNGVVGALGVELAIQEISERINDANYVAYDRQSMSIAKSQGERRESCPVCGPTSKSSFPSIEWDEFKAWLATTGVPCRT